MRTTINLNDKLYKKVVQLAKLENRSAHNLIETILMRYFEDAFFADQAEMKELNRDETLKDSLKKAVRDYKAGRGGFV